MSEPQSATGPSQREQTIQVLCEHFAQDTLTLEEFERRVDLANRASTVDQLRALLADLPITPLVPVEERPAPAARPLPSEVPAAQTLVAIMGGVERKGRWVPARVTRVLAFWGGVELDFREALLAPGITEVAIACVMGGVEIIVAPDTIVESSGIAIMGGISHHSPDVPPNANAPVLRITGFAMMGGVDITVRMPGESAKEARRRKRHERKQQRHKQNRQP